MATITQQQHHSIHGMLHNSGMPHGLGLLTTVASLPPKYRSRYLNISTKCEIPLDLSVKPLSPQIANDVPIPTTFTEVYTEPIMALERASEIATTTSQFATTTSEITTTTSEIATTINEIAIARNEDHTITPPLSPQKRKYSDVNEEPTTDEYENPAKHTKTTTQPNIKRDTTPTKPIKASDTAPRTGKMPQPTTKPTKNKATRKLKFDEETSSPVSGTIIRPLEDITDGTMQYSNGDIDPKYNIVEITDETKAELAAIKNVIGDYVCKLCRIKFDDAFGLARHRCACIVLLEYRCPECGKQFNCPANLASHRRWHKPKKDNNSGGGAAATAAAKKENRNTTNQQQQQQQQNLAKKSDELAFACTDCGKKFKRQAYLRKHQLTHKKGADKQSKQFRETTSSPMPLPLLPTSTMNATTTTTIVGTFQTYAGSSSSASSTHSHEDEGVYTVASNYDYDGDSMSDCSKSSVGYGRLQIVETGLTEEENIAAAALTNLRNCASVIQHTTLAH